MKIAQRPLVNSNINQLIRQVRFDDGFVESYQEHSNYKRACDSKPNVNDGLGSGNAFIYEGVHKSKNVLLLLFKIDHAFQLFVVD